MNNGRTQIRKFLNADRMYEEYLADWAKNPDSPFLMHFRWATHGKISVGNSHPFKIPNGAMIHNGVLRIKDLPPETSDSKFFARNIIGKLPPGWMDQGWWTGAIADMIGWNNKLAMVFDDNRFLIVNEKAGGWKDGVWYSNKSYEPVVIQPTALVTSLTGWKLPNDESDLYSDWFAKQEASGKRFDECDGHCSSQVCDCADDDNLSWCDDCYDDIHPGVEHVCDIPAAIMAEYRELEEWEAKQIKSYGAIH